MTALKRGIIGIIAIIALAGAFILLPVVPYSTAGNDRWAFLGIRANASVSPWYIVTGCGVVLDPTLSTDFGGVTAYTPVWHGASWTCGTQWTQTPWSG
jgi:hypothetical protein